MRTIRYKTVPVGTVLCTYQPSIYVPVCTVKACVRALVACCLLTDTVLVQYDMYRYCSVPVGTVHSLQTLTVG